MQFDFSHLPKTKIEAYSAPRGPFESVKSVKVPSITDGHAMLIVVSQECGEKYLREKAAKFSSDKEFQAWRNKYSQMVSNFCNRYSA